MIRKAFQVTRDAAARRRGKPRRKPAEVQVTRVHPLVWQTALELADGDATRIEIRTEEEVVVR